MHKNLTNIRSENELIKHNESRENLSSPIFYCFINALHFTKNISKISETSKAYEILSILYKYLDASKQGPPWWAKERRRRNIHPASPHAQHWPVKPQCICCPSELDRLIGCDDITCYDIPCCNGRIERWRPAQFMLINPKLV